MPAYMVVLLDSRNADWMGEYMANVPGIIRSHGGDYAGVSNGPVIKLEGTQPAPQMLAIFTFPSTEKIQEFMESEAYKPYKELRIQNSDSEIYMFGT